MHSSTDSYLGWFHSWVLWIMLWWSRDCRYLSKTLFLFPSHIYPEVEFLDHAVVSFLIFWGTSSCFPWWLYQQWIRFPLFSHPREYLLSLVFGIIAILTRWICHCGSDLHFTDDKWHWVPLFIYLWTICMSSWGKRSGQ